MHRLTPWAASRLALIVIPAIVAGCNRLPSADPPPLVDAGTLKQTEVLPYTQGAAAAGQKLRVLCHVSDGLGSNAGTRRRQA